MRRRDQVAVTLEQLIPLLPSPWSADRFVDRLSIDRRRPIKIVQSTFGYDTLSGVWISLPDQDLIGVPTDATGDRLATITCHEIAHITLGHEPQEVVPRAMLARHLAPDLSPALIAKFMGRHHYAAGPERDAETLATKLVREIRAIEGRLPVDSPLGRLTDQLL